MGKALTNSNGDQRENSLISGLLQVDLTGQDNTKQKDDVNSVIKLLPSDDAVSLVV